MNISELPYASSFKAPTDGRCQRGAGLAAAKRQAPTDGLVSVGRTPPPRGKGSTRPGRIWSVLNVATPLGSRPGAWSADRKEGPSPSGHRMTPKPMPARRKAAGTRDTTTGPPPAVPHNWPDTGMMPEPERVPTGSGEPKRTRPAGPEPADKLDTASAVNGPRDVHKDGWQPDRPSRTSLPEPVAVEAARPVPRGRGRSNASPLPDLEPVRIPLGADPLQGPADQAARAGGCW